MAHHPNSHCSSNSKVWCSSRNEFDRLSEFQFEITVVLQSSWSSTHPWKLDMLQCFINPDLNKRSEHQSPNSRKAGLSAQISPTQNMLLQSSNPKIFLQVHDLDDDNDNEDGAMFPPMWNHSYVLSPLSLPQSKTLWQPRLWNSFAPIPTVQSVGRAPFSMIYLKSNLRPTKWKVERNPWTKTLLNFVFFYSSSLLLKHLFHCVDQSPKMAGPM